MGLSRLLREFASPACFTLSEAEAAVGRASARSTIRYLQKTGYIQTVRRGLYAFDPERTEAQADRFVVASKVVRPYALAFHSALELHGVSQAASFSEVFVASPSWFVPFEFGGARIRAVLAPARLLKEGRASVKRSGASLSVAGRELSLLQCADHLEYAGGLEELLSSVEGFASVDFKKLETLLRMCGKSSLYRKVGFIVERNAARWRPPPGFLESVAARTGKGTSYFGTSAAQGGRWVRRWHLIVPPRFTEATSVG
jgi:predicted transcriptional regulator of viral defense system